MSHSLAAIESHPREGGKVTVVELSTRLSLNHGIISPLRLTTLKKSMKTARTKIASSVILSDDWRRDS